MKSPLEAATEYTKRGWSTIPLVPGQKGAHLEEWQTLRLTEQELPRFFKPDSNVGVLLGAASGGLVDVDCDTPEAITCAKELMPATLISGRGSLTSHFWYKSLSLSESLKFKDLDGQMVVELRSDQHQTAVYPSVHPSGETYKWFNSKEPLEISSDDLVERVTFVATAALIARHLPPGGRHDLALSLAGYLLKKLPETSVLEILTTAWKANNAPTSAFKDLRDIVHDTKERIDNDEPHTGRKTLDEYLPGFAARIAKYFGWTVAPNDPTARTDEGNARLFIDRFGDEVKYVWQWKKWAFWNGKRWEKDETNYVKYLCGMAIKSLYSEAAVSSTADGAELAKHALRSLSVGKIKAALEVAASHPGMTISADQFDSNDFLLNCANGTLDLNNLTMRDHDKKDYITRLVPTNYDKEAKAPQFERFMQQTLPNPDTRDFVHKAIGYSLTGDTSERCLFIAQGDGTNGKSTLLNLCADVLGDYAARAGTEVFLEKPAGSIPNDVAQLKGPRLVLASEVEQGKRLSEAQVKNFTGGSDKLVGRFLYGELFEFEPKFTAWILTNPLPRIKGTDPAIWNRLRIIPFHQVPKKIDKKLPRKLEREAEGVLAWMVRGFAKYTSDHLEPPAEIARMKDAYRVNEDSVARFAEEMCQRGPQCQQGLIELFEAFREWAVDTEEWKMSRRLFNQRLDNLGCGTIGAGARAVKTDIQLLDGGGEGPDDDSIPGPAVVVGGSKDSEGAIDAVESHTRDDREGEEAGGTTQAQKGASGENADAGKELPSRLADRAEDGASAHESGAVDVPDTGTGLDTNAMDIWAIDTETTGLDPRSNRVRVLQIWNPSHGGEPEVYDLDKDYDLAQDAIYAARDSRAPFVLHNAAFDIPFLERTFPGIADAFHGRTQDTMILSQLVYAGLRDSNNRPYSHSLGACLERELDVSLDKSLQVSDWSGPLSPEQLEYAGDDIRFLPALVAALAERAKVRGISSDIIRLELDLTPVLAQMSDRGIAVDVEGWSRKAEESAGIVEFCEHQIKSILRSEVPEDFEEDVDDLNLGSPQQIQRVFYEAGVYLPDTKDDTLAATLDDLGLMELLRAHRKAKKLRDSYGYSWLRNVDDEGVVHPRWKQLGAATGRMSAADPNIQQIPRSSDFRRLFHAREGHKFVVADYSQIELRIAAKIARDPKMLRAFKNGQDLHTKTGAEIVDPNKATRTTELLLMRAGVSADRTSAALLRRLWESMEGSKAAIGCVEKQIFTWASQESGRGQRGSTAGIIELPMEGGNLAQHLSEVPQGFLRTVREWNELVRTSQGSEPQEQPPVELDDAVQIVSFLGTRTLEELEPGWKGVRQIAKSLGFGLVYGMGAKKLQVYAQTEYGVTLTPEEAYTYRKRWLDSYRWIKAWHDSEGKKLRNATDLTIKTLAGRIRNDVGLYTERLNTPVQGSGADGLKAAVLRVQREGYHPVALVHDELVVEVPVGGVDAVQSRIEAIMVEEMEKMINRTGDPVPVEVEGMVSERWEK